MRTPHGSAHRGGLPTSGGSQGTGVLSEKGTSKSHGPGGLSGGHSEGRSKGRVTGAGGTAHTHCLPGGGPCPHRWADRCAPQTCAPVRVGSPRPEPHTHLTGPRPPRTLCLALWGSQGPGTQAGHKHKRFPSPGNLHLQIEIRGCLSSASTRPEAARPWRGRPPWEGRASGWPSGADRRPLRGQRQKLEFKGKDRGRRRKGPFTAPGGHAELPRLPLALPPPCRGLCLPATSHRPHHTRLRSLSTVTTVSP